MNDMVELRFFNYAATPKEVKFSIGRDGIEPVMAWYGSYFAGDRYNVFVDGKRVEKDRNGELVSPVIDGVVK